MIDYENTAEIVGLVLATLEEMEPMHRAADAVVQSIYEDAYSGDCGPYLGVDRGVLWPDNVHYEYVQHVAAHLGYRLPRATAKSHRGRGQKATADGIERALNRWTRERQVGRTLNRLLEDMLHGYAAAIVIHKSNDVLGGGSREGKRRLPKGRTVLMDGQILADRNPTDEVDAHMPQVVRLDRRDVFFDTLAGTADEAMFTGHKMLMDRRKLAAIAEQFPEHGYDADAISKLAQVEFSANDKRAKAGALAYRDLVAVHEVWFPDWRLDEADAFEAKHEVKTHGTLVTVAEASSGGAMVRKARPYYGWRHGAYVIGGMVEHPQYPVPTSPCVMAHPAARELNGISQAALLSARNYKRIVLVDAGVQDLAAKIKTTPHDFIVEVAGLLQEGKPAIVAIEIGGVTPQMLEMRQQQMERYERVSGLSETRRGRAKSGATATGDLIADEGADKRLVRIERPWDEFVGGIYRRAGFFIYDSRDVVFSFGEEESEQIAKKLGMDKPGTMPPEIRAATGAPDEAAAWQRGDEVYFRGGRGTEGSYDDLDIAVDVASQRKADDPAQAAAVSGFVAEAMQLIPAMVQVREGVDWEGVMRDLAESKGVPHMARYVNVPILLQRPELAMMQVDMASTVGAGKTRPSITLAQQPARPQRQATAPAQPGGAQPGMQAQAAGTV